MMDLPKRKHIRLKDYDYSQNNIYFVTVCTHNRAELFGEIVGATLRGRPPLIYAKLLIYNDFSHVTLSSAFRENIKTTGRATRHLMYRLETHKFTINP